MHRSKQGIASVICLPNQLDGKRCLATVLPAWRTRNRSPRLTRSTDHDLLQRYEYEEEEEEEASVNFVPFENAIFSKMAEIAHSCLLSQNCIRRRDGAAYRTSKRDDLAIDDARDPEWLSSWSSSGPICQSA